MGKSKISPHCLGSCAVHVADPAGEELCEIRVT
jgi:hypothetical protein